jgi:hypothetical protein
MESKHHPNEETLERYLFGSLPEHGVELVEEHLLVCHFCIDAAEQLLSFVQSLRSAANPKRAGRARAAGTHTYPGS